MRKPIRSVSAASVALVLGLSLAVAGCGEFSLAALQGKKAIKDAHALYQAQRYEEAVVRYEEALAADPSLYQAHFFLANSYDNMFKPSRLGEPENDAFMQKAIQHYQKAADLEQDPKMRRLAYDYLVAAYGPEKLNDPSQAEPIVKKLIEMDPNDHTSYFGLAQIYENAGRYEEAEQALLKAKEMKPNDPTVYTTLSAFYNRQGDFERTMEALNRAADLNPNDPQGFQLVATYYWEKAYKDHRLSSKEKLDYILKGIGATDKALALNKDYAEALTYKNILLRMQANETTDREKQAALIRQADTLRSRAIELSKKKASGIP